MRGSRLAAPVDGARLIRRLQSEVTGADVNVPEVVHRPRRLQALAALEANAESSAEALDRIAALACRVLPAPVVLVNLVGADRQRFVGCSGEWTSTREMPVTHGFCPFALGADEAFAFTDARADPELADNPVVEQLGVVAYAGVPLRAADGEPVGTLCAIDTAPHEWSAEDLALLSDLAASAVAELQLLAASRHVARSRARVRAVAALSAALRPSLPVRDVVDEVMGAVACIGATAVWLLVMDDSGRGLRAAAAAGDDPEVVARHARVPLDAQLALAGVGDGDFLPTRSAVRERVAPVLDVVPDVGSMAWLALEAGDRRLGALGACFADERPLSPEDEEYLAAVAGVVSLSLAR